jgi:predicted NUDIX family NTP pyrophosphohydrolase
MMPMAASVKTSAGLLMFRRAKGLEVFLVHPGGPFWKNKDEGAWTIPKGLVEEGEELLVAAKREFQEETGILPEPPFIELGSARLKSGKTIHAWAFETRMEECPTPCSNTFPLEWPPKSGKIQEFPEVDRCGFFSVEEADAKIHVAQRPFIERLQHHV